MTVSPHQNTVLMYHAIGDAGVDGADDRYTVSRATFCGHLRTIRDEGRQGSSVRSILERGISSSSVAVTFDDGSSSNRHAAETLAAVGMSADFFVNPSTIGKHGFLSWSDLREMLGLGMSIQSHGVTHRYLNDLSPEEVRRELAQSKFQIEQEVGHAVTLFAPPGGRMPKGFCAAAAGAGYQAVCSSRVGVWPSARRVANASPKSANAVEIPRLAVLASTNRSQFQRWVTASRGELVALQSRALILSSAKRAMGNSRYERLRQFLVGGLPS